MSKKKLFGTSGIRGDTKKLFDNQFCFDLGIAFSQFLDNHQQYGPIAIGKDPRPSSPRIADSFTQGLFFCNRKVFDQEVCPVPAINYILKTSKMAASAMITGSHIKAELNGIKFFCFEEEILKEHEKEIEKIYFKIKGKNKFKKFSQRVAIKQNRANQDYQDMLARQADIPYPSWKIVVDCSNGCQSVIMPQLLKSLGLEVIVLNDNIQGEFIARDTETQDAVSFLSKKVTQEKADFGIAFDPDGDRVVFVDKRGNFIPGDITGSLIAKYLKDVNKIITPINTSQVAEYLGKPVIRTKVGSPYVVKAIKDNKEIFGFEANGGGIFAKIMLSRDAGSSTITLLNILKQENKTLLEELVSLLPKFHLIKLKVDCPSSLNDKIINQAQKQYQPVKVETLDGLKLWLDKTSWVLFRPSSNAPEFRVFAEAKSAQKAKNIAEEGIKFVKDIIKKEKEK